MSKTELIFEVYNNLAQQSRKKCVGKWEVYGTCDEERKEGDDRTEDFQPGPAPGWGTRVPVRLNKLTSPSPRTLHKENHCYKYFVIFIFFGWENKKVTGNAFSSIN
jgi:hypothetical protein